jgi:tetratricopeptide (TPR) repeat protein
MDNLPTRPLPIGAFGLPFGFLLLPPGPDTEPVRESLLAGRLPAEWPEALRGHQLAADGDTDAALKVFTAADDPVSRFNRFVLDPDGVEDVGALRDAVYPFGPLVDLVLFALGRTDTAPETDGQDGELAALLLAARAVEDLQSGDAPKAVLALRTAIEEARPVSPALAGVLHGALGQACKAAGDAGGAIAALQVGTKLLAGTDLNVAVAEQCLELAATFHELADGRPELLQGAVTHYHNALQALRPGEAPEVFAAAHAGLASAYLTMPLSDASDQLRLGIAVGSLRTALTIYTRETHPAEWSSVQLNLANALVYAPSTHRRDNLAEAVELYEAVLQTRDRNVDPIGYARALANQGNALAHLGEKLVARAKLGDARELFAEAEEWDAVNSVRDLIDGLGRVSTDA